MQRYREEEHQEREPLGRSPDYSTPPRQAGADAYNYNYAGAESPYYDDASLQRPQDAYRMQQHQPYQSYQPYVEHDDASSGSRGYAHEPLAPTPPQHNDFTAYNRSLSRDGQGHAYAQHVAQSNITPGADNFSEHASGGMAGLAYSVADHNARESGMEAMGGTVQLPPPPSRIQYPNAPNAGYNSQPGGYAPEPVYNRGPGQQLPAQGSGSSLNPFSTPSATHSPARSLRSFGGESFGDDPYQGMPSNGHRYHDASLGVVNPNDIVDDGDDGLGYAANSQRNSMLSLPRSERGRPGAGAAGGAGAGAAAGIGAAAAAGGVLNRSGHGRSDSELAREKPDNWVAPDKGHSKKCKWLVIILIFLVVAGAIVGGVVGSMIAGNKKSGGGSGDSAADDTKKNGDLDINSKEIKALLNNKDLHKVFPGMDYTPLNTQYPDCIHNPPSQNNVTRDVAVLSQLTNKIRLYGTDCNQTQMVIHAVNQLKMQNDVKIWLGVWQDGNATTNARQLAQMWDILDEYGDKPFEGIIVANEILFRKEMTMAKLGTILDAVRTNLTAKNIKLPVASSDLGDNWQQGLADKSDYVMANIHPFFAGVKADQAASWTYGFWTDRDKQFWKSDMPKNVISETGWPSDGGKDCGASTTCDSSTPGAVASIDNMNQFMNDWVCQALANGTNYFWFEAFDEPWKIRFNEKGKEWEDKWGLMDVNRKLKSGVKIPDCGGKTV